MSRPRLGPDLLSVVQVMKARPGMFLRKDSLQLLEAYVSGFQMSLRANGIVPEVGSKSWESFVQWLQRKYNRLDEAGWATTLRDCHATADDMELFQIFFEEIDEFLSGEF